MTTRRKKLERLAVMRRTLREHGFDFDAMAALMFDPEVRPTLEKRYKHKPGARPSPEAVNELAAALKRRRQGISWKAAAPTPRKADELSRKASWLKPEKLEKLPMTRRDSSHRKQAIGAAAALIGERLDEKVHLDDQTRRIRGRIVTARQRRR